MSDLVRVLAWNCRNAAAAILEINHNKPAADFVFLSETQMKPERIAYFEDYLIVERLDYSRPTIHRPMRGIMLLKRKDSDIEITVEYSSSQDSCILANVNGLYLLFVYLPPLQETEKNLEIIENMLELVGNSPCALFGDLNLDPNKSYLAKAFKDLTERLEGHSLTLVPLPEGLNTFSSHIGSSCIDHLLVNDPTLVVRHGLNEQLHCSDHSPLDFTLKLPTNKENLNRCTNYRRPWRLAKLHFANKKERNEFIEFSGSFFDGSLDRHLQLLEDSQSTTEDPRQIADRMHATINNTVENTASNIIGRTKKSHKFNHFFTPRLLALKSILKESKRRIKTLITQEEITVQLERISNFRTQYNREIKDRTMALVKDYFSKISVLPVPDMLKLASRAKKRSQKPQNNKKEPKVDEFAKHFSKIYSSTEEIPQLQKKSRSFIEIDEEDLIKEETVLSCLSKMPNSKATDPGNLPIEFFKIWSRYLLKPLTRFFNFLVKHGIVPTQWRKGLLYPV